MSLNHFHIQIGLHSISLLRLSLSVFFVSFSKSLSRDWLYRPPLTPTRSFVVDQIAISHYQKCLSERGYPYAQRRHNNTPDCLLHFSAFCGLAGDKSIDTVAFLSFRIPARELRTCSGSETTYSSIPLRNGCLRRDAK
jgi:hypothetical protein